MKLKPTIFFSTLALISLSLVLTLLKPQTETVLLAPAATPTVLAAVTETDHPCHIRDVLPDPSCTPGSIDSTITQENIQQTICVSGYTTKVRPKTSYTNKLKKEQIVEYGFTDTNLSHYEEDHLISLELGGNPTDPKNLWPEPDASPNPKDKIENECHKKVCLGQISLADAQNQIATNWPTACQ